MITVEGTKRGGETNNMGYLWEILIRDLIDRKNTLEIYQQKKLCEKTIRRSVRINCEN